MLCENKINEVNRELVKWTIGMADETHYSLSVQQLENIPMKHIEKYLRTKKLKNIK